MKTKIGVDLDSILAEIGPPLNEFHNREWGTNFSVDDYTDYGLGCVWGCSPDEVIDRVYAFYASEAFDEIPPVSGSQQGIDYLAANYELMVITSRPDWIEDKTRRWLDRHFPKKFNEVIHTNQFSKNPHTMLKSEVGSRCGISYMLEDSFEYAADLANSGVFVYLRDMTWNRSYTTTSKMQRFYDWKEIESYL